MPPGAAVAESRAEALRRGSELLGSLAEAELLLRFVLRCSRVQLYGGARQPLVGEELEDFERVLHRRLEGEPLQYITGTQAFRSLEVRVGPGALIPRPETELLVEEALSLLASPATPIVVDVGTGSGAIALSIATELPSAQVWATEISPEALVWARRNLARSRVRLVEGDLLSPMPPSMRRRVDLIVSNPPYLSEAEWQAAPVDVRHHEPATALKSEREGLEVTARLVEEAPGWLASGGWLVFETSPELAERVHRLMSSSYADVAIVDDLAGRPRIGRGRRP